jgi:hypothetical protein
VVAIGSRWVVRFFLAVYRWAVILLFPPKTQLHTDRFAYPAEFADITSVEMDGHSLLMGVAADNRILSVRPTPKQHEVGNILVDARTRGGKGILAIPQILT